MKKVAIVCSEFNKRISVRLLEGALAYCQEHFSKLDEENIQKSGKGIVYNETPFMVDGAVEIPLLCQDLLATYDAIVALGVVIKGETAHFEYVCRAVTDGVMRVMLDSGKVIGFGVLMTYDVKQAEARVVEGDTNKGWQCVQTYIVVCC